MLKLGTLVKDKVSELSGMLTILAVDVDNNLHYLFQPSLLNPKTKQPVDQFWITQSRVEGGEEMTVELPKEILNTYCEDIATGFNGTAIQIFYYLNGCIHVDVKPKGVIEETGESIKAKEFDIRRLKGPMIKQLSADELEKSKVTAPSPDFLPKQFEG